MRAMVIVKATPESEAGMLPRREPSSAMGKFNEELVAGYWIWQVQSLAEAVDWVKRCPNPGPGETEIEIRPIFEAEDFAAETPPEIAERNERLREAPAGRG